MKRFLIKLILFVLIVLTGVNNADAVIQGWVPPEDYGVGDSSEIGVEVSEAKEGLESKNEQKNTEDIFGSEQVFPFPPGLGN